MVKLRIIWRTMTISQNPIVVLSLKRGNTKRSIKFRNGCTYRLTWPQFRSLRDSYPFLSRCFLTQLGDDLFRLEDGRSRIVCISKTVPLFSEIMEDFAVQQESENFFHLKNEKIELVGSTDMLVCIQEQKSGEYECDCQGKVVLDVGGFEGESAAYFWMKGAKKLIIYEPVAEHVELIMRNMTLNHIKAEVHATGIGDKDGTQIIYYDKIDPGLGLHSKGKKSIEIKITNASEVLEQSGADIAKFDCESAEECLVHVQAQILQKIGYYIIEVHSAQIRKAIIEKFRSAGFVLENEIRKPNMPDFSVLSFRKIPLFSKLGA